MKSLGILCFITLAVVANANLLELYGWNQLDYDWPSAFAKRQAIKLGDYIPENNIPQRLAVGAGKIFLTVTRIEDGVASSLNYVDESRTNHSPKLKPYPNWDANYNPAYSCHNNVCEQPSTIVSAAGVHVDKCDRLWVIDDGFIRKNNNIHKFVDPAIVIFDLKTDKLIRRFNIPPEKLTLPDTLSNIIVEVDRDCSNAYAYVSVATGYRLMVYSFASNEFYFVDEPFFRQTQGISAMSFGPRKMDGSKDIYFHGVAKEKEFKVSTRILRNKSLLSYPGAQANIDYVGVRETEYNTIQEVSHERTGVIFYDKEISDGIYCWNTRRRYNRNNFKEFIAVPPKPSMLTLDMSIHNDQLFTLSRQRSDVQYNPNKVNIRVIYANVNNLIKDTKCQA